MGEDDILHRVPSCQLDGSTRRRILPTPFPTPRHSLTGRTADWQAPEQSCLFTVSNPRVVFEMAFKCPWLKFLMASIADSLTFPHTAVSYTQL
jgi:hypothetical protein